MKFNFLAFKRTVKRIEQNKFLIFFSTEGFYQYQAAMSSDEGNSSSSLKRKPEKTPTATLQELCVQEGEVLMHEDIPHEANAKLFSCKAIAFGMSAIGTGRSKKEAKHEACANLMGELIFSRIRPIDSFRLVSHEFHNIS